MLDSFKSINIVLKVPDLKKKQPNILLKVCWAVLKI